MFALGQMKDESMSPVAKSVLTQSFRFHSNEKPDIPSQPLFLHVLVNSGKPEHMKRFCCGS